MNLLLMVKIIYECEIGTNKKYLESAEAGNNGKGIGKDKKKRHLNGMKCPQEEEIIDNDWKVNLTLRTKN